MRRVLLLSMFVLAAAVRSFSVHAAGLESLLMPGEVSQAHAKIEQECSNCHDRKNRERQPQLCLTCHKDVAADIASKHGYHGIVANRPSVQCGACHTEHRGRDADIVKLDPGLFDHAFTDFPLSGAHANVTCTQCHVPGKRFAAAPSQCIDCHKQDDPHAGKLGSNCDSCHSNSSWPATKFDHAKTSFPLLGAHADLTCAKCHANEHFKGAPTQCVACHATDDVHQGARGTACSNCHTAQSWNNSRFDHAKETGFALTAGHDALECTACHKSGDFKQKLSRECASCHLADDPHAHRFGNACETCHSPTVWPTVKFDHARDAHFALHGKHAKLQCETCHTARIKEQPPQTQCNSCHKLDDVHAGTSGAACDQCHGDDVWRPAAQFNHEFTSFPLLGLHIAVPCARCHADSKFAQTPGQCIDCHAKQDVHKGSMGRQCSDCHSANGWNIWQFDHAARTNFPLSGAHAKLQCEACHRDTTHMSTTVSDCASCHATDDIHLGQFGHQCQQCHSTNTFRGAKRP